MLPLRKPLRDEGGQANRTPAELRASWRGGCAHYETRDTESIHPRSSRKASNFESQVRKFVHAAKLTMNGGAKL